MDLIAKTYLNLKYFDPDQDMEVILNDLRDYLQKESGMTKEKAIELIEESGEYYDILPDKYQKNRDIAKKALELESIPYMDPFRNDEEIAFYMLADNCTNECLSRCDLLKDHIFVKNLLYRVKGNNWSVISLINCKNTFIDEEILALAKSYLDLSFTVPFCRHFKDDKEVALRIFSYNKYTSLRHTSLKNDPEFVEELLNQKGNTLYIDDLITNCVVNDKIKEIILKNYGRGIIDLFKTHKKW